MKGRIEIFSNDTNIMLRGDVMKITSSRSAMMYLRNNFDYTVGKEEIVIENVSSINEALSDINIIADYSDCEVSYDSDVKDEIKEYQKEESLFHVFSEKARNIRDEHPDANEFDAFCKSISKNLAGRTLYPLQLLSAYHMAFAQNSCNFSVPGAGKTSIVYGAYSYLHSLPESDPKHVDCLFIIGPLSCFGPWELEFNECFGYSASTKRLIGGMPKQDKELYLSMKDIAEITLTSYQSVPTLKDKIITFLKNHKTMLVLDEAHKIKNYSGAITAASVLELAPYATSRIVLTGTPAPQGYADLNNLYRFIWPNKDIIGFSISQLLNMTQIPNDSRVDTLLDRVSPFFIRIKKSDLNIPAAKQTIIKVKMSPAQKDIYDVVEGRFMSALTEATDGNMSREFAKAKLIRLMQIATNPALLRNSLADYYDENGDVVSETESDKLFLDQVRRFWKDELPQKYIVATNLAKKIVSEGGRVIVWATYIRNVEYLKSYMEASGLKVKTLYGATPVEGSDETEKYVETRESIVREFNQPNSSFSVIIANPFAVAESISLHKQCHNAIYLERNFNAANFIQSKDRIHRYGLSKDTVTNYYYLVSEDTIDETINSRLEEKEQRLLDIVERMPIPLFANASDDEGFEDIKAVIRDYVSRTQTI